MIFVTSYKRPEALLILLKELEGESVYVIDDGSDYDYTQHAKYCEYSRMLLNYSKKGFYKLWKSMLNIAHESDANEFIFLQDDLYDVNLQALRNEFREYEQPAALNVMDVGPDRGWSRKGYVDCNFITSREALEAINWRIMPPSPKRWDRNPNLSSGVGQRLTQAFGRNGVAMELPEKNYASHGDHESVMHPKERKANPLIAKTGQ